MNRNTKSEDPVEGAAAMHPKGEVAGAVAGTLTGAALGTALGPLGTLAGAVVGGAFGAVVGGGISEGISPAGEGEEWMAHFQKEPFAEEEGGFENHGPAFQVGWLLHSETKSFEDSEELLRAGWEGRRGQSKFEWRDAIPAASAGWNARARQRGVA